MAQLPKRQIQSAFAGGNSVRNTGNDRTKHWTSHDFMVSMIYQNGEKAKNSNSDQLNNYLKLDSCVYFSVFF